MYCYSFDEDRFTGNCATLGQALAEAHDEGLSNDYATVWIGEHRDPTEWITPARLGGHIEEYISEALGDEVGEVAENFSLTAAQQIELGQLILNWIEAGPKFNCYGVKNITRHSLTAPEPDTQTADLFQTEGGSAA